jgi:hypothetical protein
VGDFAALDLHGCNRVEVPVEDLVVASDDGGVHGDSDTLTRDLSPVDSGVEAQVGVSTRTGLELTRLRHGVELHDQRTDVASDVENRRCSELVMLTHEDGTS